MSQYLLDTNVWSHLIRGLDKALIQKIGALDADQIYISPIVRGELELGLAKGDGHPKRKQQLEQAISLANPTIIDQAVAIKYAQIRAQLELAGTPIGRNDTWIAAEALHHNLVLITDNIREFERVAGLRVENWTE
jgi:tRNA(fMet)-specific endonuclease VapC